jgi:hypothetical protein
MPFLPEGGHPADLVIGDGTPYPSSPVPAFLTRDGWLMEGFFLRHCFRSYFGCVVCSLGFCGSWFGFGLIVSAVWFYCLCVGCDGWGIPVRNNAHIDPRSGPKPTIRQHNQPTHEHSRLGNLLTTAIPAGTIVYSRPTPSRPPPSYGLTLLRKKPEKTWCDFLTICAFVIHAPTAFRRRSARLPGCPPGGEQNGAL